PSDESYMIDGEFLIDKPMTILGSKGQWVKLKDQSNLFHQGHRGSIFKITSSDVIVQHLYLDGNSRENYSVIDGENVHYSDQGGKEHGITGINVEGDGQKLIKNILITDNYIKDSSNSNIMVTGEYFG